MALTTNEIYALLVRYSDGETSSEENSRIEIIIQSNDYWKIEYERLKALNRTINTAYPYSIDSDHTSNFEALRLHITANRQKTKVNTFWPRMVKYCAAAILIFIAALFYFTKPSKNEFKSFTLGHTYKTEAQEIKTIHLADGSTITLNQNSRLEVDKNYNSKNRRVQLHGEAYFDVTKNADKPFIVKAKQTTTKVLGTSFEIGSKTNGDVYLKLYEGKIQFTALTNSTLLDAGETINYSPSHSAIKKQKVKNLLKMGWNSGLSFKDVKLICIIRQLEILKHIKINIPASMENWRYTVSFEGLDAQESLRLLKDVTECDLIKKQAVYHLIP